MSFPVYLTLGPLALHPHWVFEVLAYLVSGRIYVWLRARLGDPLPDEQRWWIVAAAAVGAAIGGKLLYWLSDPALTWDRRQDLLFLMGGKSIVGALVGGFLAVEWAKRRLGVTRRTGDLFAIPVAIGMAVGRVGCFLTGLADHTHGLPANLPWAVDFGDGIPRHPTQLYEIAFLLLLIGVLSILARRPYREGDLFKVFLIAYLVFRFCLEWLKPGVPLAGLIAIQWVCLAMLLYYAQLLIRPHRRDLVVADG